MTRTLISINQCLRPETNGDNLHQSKATDPLILRAGEYDLSTAEGAGRCGSGYQAIIRELADNTGICVNTECPWNISHQYRK